MPIFDDAYKIALTACLGTYGQAVTYTDSNAEVHDLEGIFSNAFEGVDPNSGYTVVSSLPNLGIKTADWPKLPEEGEQITIAATGDQYIVRHAEDDGEGHAVVFLNRV